MDGSPKSSAQTQIRYVPLTPLKQDPENSSLEVLDLFDLSDITSDTNTNKANQISSDSKYSNEPELAPEEEQSLWDLWDRTLSQNSLNNAYSSSVSSENSPLETQLQNLSKEYTSFKGTITKIVRSTSTIFRKIIKFDQDLKIYLTKRKSDDSNLNKKLNDLKYWVKEIKREYDLQFKELSKQINDLQEVVNSSYKNNIPTTSSVDLSPKNKKELIRKLYDLLSVDTTNLSLEQREDKFYEVTLSEYKTQANALANFLRDYSPDTATEMGARLFSIYQRKRGKIKNESA